MLREERRRFKRGKSPRLPQQQQQMQSEVRSSGVQASQFLAQDKSSSSHDFLIEFDDEEDLLEGLQTPPESHQLFEELSVLSTPMFKAKNEEKTM